MAASSRRQGLRLYSSGSTREDIGDVEMHIPEDVKKIIAESGENRVIEDTESRAADSEKIDTLTLQEHPSENKEIATSSKKEEPKRIIEAPIYINRDSLDELSISIQEQPDTDVTDQLKRIDNFIGTSPKDKCLIMLALSTPSGPQNTSEIWMTQLTNPVAASADTKVYSGGYQLEASTKYIIDKGLCAGKRVIEIVLLETTRIRQKCSKAVYLRIPTEERLSSDPTPLKEYHDYEYLVGTAADNERPTPSEIYRYCAWKYVQNLKTEGKCESDIKLRFVQYYLADPMEGPSKWKPRDIRNQELRKDMSNLINLVRQEAATEDASDTVNGPEIYIDIHGGPRSTQQLVLNMLSILSEEDIHIPANHILTVDAASAPIDDAGEGFRVNDFVAGIHEFVNNGRMKSLDRFYASNPMPGSERLRHTMRKLSSAIQVCDMNKFEQQLQALADNLTNFKRNQANNHDYLYSFINLIVRGYDPLIKWENNKYVAKKDVVEEIRWCRSKGLYQQMLTLCEAKVPLYMRYQVGNSHGVFDFDDAIDQKHFSLRSRDITRRGNRHTVYPKEFLNAFNYLITHYGSYKPEEERFYIVKENNSHDVFYIRCQDHVDLVDRFMRMHCELKRTRNMSNHALDLNANATVAGPDNRREHSDTDQIIRYQDFAGVYKSVDEGNMNSLDQDVLEYIETVNELMNGHVRLKIKWKNDHSHSNSDGFTDDLYSKINHVHW